MKSSNQHLFSQIPSAEIQRSSFDRSHCYKTTFDAGLLVPFFVDEVLPGDTFKADVSMLCRMATPIAPIMDNLYLETFFFYVPNRLLWDHWKEFNGEQKNPGDSTDYLVPTDSGSTFQVGSLGDYFGMPTEVNLKYNVMPFRAYWSIWNEWFRDENLQDSAPISQADTGNVWSSTDPINTNMHWFNLAPRGKRHDYFTSALPWPQKGPGVELPLGESAAVFYSPSSLSQVSSLGTGVQRTDASSGTLVTRSGYTDTHLFADLSSASAATINTLRQAFQLQRLLERDARSGTRYTEILRSHFGVISPDARLQRPEYLGGSSTRINVNPVVQNSSTDSISPQGNLAAFGVAGDRVHGFSKSFTEHGYIIGLVTVRADLTYQQGLNRMWSRQTRFDFYWPSLAHLGEQAILRKEIYATGDATSDETVFGYQERFAEYRYYPSQITGKFRSTYAQSLDSWHLAQKFETAPTLGDSFIRENPPIDRVIAVPSEPQFLFDSYISLKCIRPMPVYSVPGLMDHF